MAEDFSNLRPQAECIDELGKSRMPNQIAFEEDLRRLAADNFKIAARTCRSCGHMHALWPYIRLARASIAAEGASSPLDPLLAGLISEGRRHILVAGSQDTGLLALIARACGVTDPDIIILDRCPTPLESCRRLARSWSLPIATMHEDLMNFDMRAHFDLILVHDTLQYISLDRRGDVLARLRQALRRAGRLVLLVNTSSRIIGGLAEEARNGYADWVIEELERQDIPLPEEREAFAARLRVHAENRERRYGAFFRLEEVHDLLTTAGFSICQSTEIKVSVADRMQQFISQLSARRFVVVAEPHE
jgi:SAM-dependent methyltransferase